MLLSRLMVALPLLFLLLSCQTSVKAPERGPAADGSSLSEIFDRPGWEYLSSRELSNYENIWAISDVHGESNRLIKLLKKAKLVNSGCNVEACEWNAPAKDSRGQLLIVVGDNINKGSDSVGVVRLLYELQNQTIKKQGRVILLLGNHEAEVLANVKKSNKETPELERSANRQKHRSWLDIHNDLGKRVSKGELRDESKFGEVLKSMKVGALLGDWLFLHSGYINGEPDPSGLASIIREAGMAQHQGSLASAKGDFEGSQQFYSQIGDEQEPLSALLSERDWTQRKKLLADMKEKLDLLGVQVLLVGHDPGAINDHGRIAIYKDWLVKLDTGMSREMRYSTGRMLQCPIQQNGKIELLNESGKSNCFQFSETGRMVIPILGY